MLRKPTSNHHSFTLASHALYRVADSFLALLNPPCDASLQLLALVLRALPVRHAVLLLQVEASLAVKDVVLRRPGGGLFVVGEAEEAGESQEHAEVG